MITLCKHHGVELLESGKATYVNPIQYDKTGYCEFCGTDKGKQLVKDLALTSEGKKYIFDKPDKDVIKKELGMLGCEAYTNYISDDVCLESIEDIIANMRRIQDIRQFLHLNEMGYRFYKINKLLDARYSNLVDDLRSIDETWIKP